MNAAQNRSRLLVAVALGAVAIGAIVFLATRPSGSPTATTAGASLGGTDPELALWRRLQSLESWLPTFAGALKDPEPEPQTVLAAFATVADKLASERGFWRDTVPNELLRCDREPERPACRRLSEGLPEVTEGEALARQIRRLDDSRAGVFLTRNAEAMVKWLYDFAPRDASLEAMRQTGYWERELAPAAKD